ncbi:MAG TPA: helix-turn-helix transcriptional regulator [Azospirillaceae bacterium]|nr:helix-turn-helix transcriptional regulator [Azospirillaceae bacterium]
MTMTDIRPRTRPAGSFGALLRRWRQARGTSQLDLALTCATSQRHISFLESGRARPSRGMVLNLGGALAVPLRHQDAMLLAAGFAPMFAARPPDAPELQPVQAAVDRMLAQQAPYPAVVVDRHYTLIQANPGALRLLAFLLDLEGPPAEPLNFARLLFSPPMAAILENFQEVAGWTLRRLRAEALLEDPLAEGFGPLRDLDDRADVAEHAKAALADDAPVAPTLTLRFKKDGVRLSLLTVIASMGTPLDAGLQDLRVELFFPADAATEAWFRAG